MLDKIRDDVRVLMGNDDNGHGFEHVERVFKIAVKIAEEKRANVEIVALAALLHDADDYKFVGAENAAKLANARRIMTENHVEENKMSQVCEIILTMGYSKFLQGIRPQTLEGQIVSDADMLDALGAVSVVRTVMYTVTHGSRKLFDRNMFPENNLTKEKYTAKGRDRDSAVNHFFDKLLKLKYILFTPEARREADIRHRFMVDFLREFFREQDCFDWIDYLEEYEKKEQKTA